MKKYQIPRSLGEVRDCLAYHAYLALPWAITRRRPIENLLLPYAGAWAHRDGPGPGPPDRALTESDFAPRWATNPRQCPFCGERALIRLLPQFDQEGWAFDDQGQPLEEGITEDFVQCEICHAMAPVDVWRGAWSHVAPMVRPTFIRWCVEDGIELPPGVHA